MPRFLPKDVRRWYDRRVDDLAGHHPPRPRLLSAYKRVEYELRTIHNLKRYGSHRTFLICYERRHPPPTRRKK